MAWPSTGDPGTYPQRRSTSPRPLVSTTDFQTLLAIAYAYEQRRRAAAAPALRIINSREPEGIDELRNRIKLAANIEDVMDVIAQRAMALTKASGVAVAFALHQGMKCLSRAGVTAPDLGVYVTAHSSFSSECLRSGNVLCCEDSEIDSRVNLAACRELNIRSILAVPIRRQQRVIGILELFSGWVGAFNHGDAVVLQQLLSLIPDTIQPPAPDTGEQLQSRSSPQPDPVAVSCDRVGSTCATPQLLSQKAPLKTLERYSDHRKHIDRNKLIVLAVMSALALITVVRRRIELQSMHTMLSVRRAEPVAAPPRLPPPQPASTVEKATEDVITGIHIHRRPEFTTVLLDLNSAATYSSGRLHHPERIYFDLADHRVAEGLAKSEEMADAGDQFVRRIRLGPTEDGGTRVVLDLNCACEYSSVASPSEPYRLVIIVQSPPHGIDRVPFPTDHPPAANPRSSTSQPASRHLSAGDIPISGLPFVDLQVVIDPGHGGSDRGTVGPSGLEEKEVVLDVAERLGKLLSDRLGAEVTFTRTGDYFVPLETRSAVANSISANLFVSIHANSSSSRAVRGVETFYLDPSSIDRLQRSAGHKPAHHDAIFDKIAGSRRLAAAVQHALYTKLAASDPQMRDRGVKTAPLTVLVAPNMPSILSEISFMSSPKEEGKLKDGKYREHIAEALYRGIVNYLSATRGRQSKRVDRSAGGMGRISRTDAVNVPLGGRNTSTTAGNATGNP